MPAAHLPQKPALIEYKNITVARNGRKVLDGIDLSIKDGENIAILGPNGAGKSSLIKTINREIYPLFDGSSSYLRILGEEYWDVFELRKHLGIVSEDVVKNHLLNLSCRELVLSGFFSSFGLWQRDVSPAMESKARETMEFLQVAHLADISIHEVSSGEARRVLISRALVPEPAALLLDEPTASLDPAASRSLLLTLRRLVSRGKNLIVVTHNLTDIIPEIERVILMNHGRIMADGPKAEILTAESLSAFFGIALEIEQRQGYFHWWYA